MTLSPREKVLLFVSVLLGFVLASLYFCTDLEERLEVLTYEIAEFNLAQDIAREDFKRVSDDNRAQETLLSSRLEVVRESNRKLNALLATISLIDEEEIFEQALAIVLAQKLQEVDITFPSKYTISLQAKVSKQVLKSLLTKLYPLRADFFDITSLDLVSMQSEIYELKMVLQDVRLKS